MKAETATEEDVEWGFRDGHANIGLLIHASVMLRLIPLYTVSFENRAGVQLFPGLGKRAEIHMHQNIRLEDRNSLIS